MHEKCLLSRYTTLRGHKDCLTYFGTAVSDIHLKLGIIEKNQFMIQLTSLGRLTDVMLH